MDYFNFIISVAAYVENRITSDFDYNGLQRATGFSIPHIRDVFRERTKIPLARYVLYRKVSNAAFDIIHTDRKILDIAEDYGFESYDTFTRAFKRYTDMTPSEFRKKRLPVGRVMLAAGMYGPGILKENSTPQYKPDLMEVEEYMKNIERSTDSCILYGVKKVEYTFEECTPFPSALKSCLNYMGQDISYSYLMAASGAAFRLRWNTKYWDGGNVDIMCIYDDPTEVFKRSFDASGRSYKIIERNSGASKEDFTGFIKDEIDKGRPVIALGIIGPPEACIVTGYRDNGQTLLGWNFFQSNPEFAKDTEIDESGYFISRSWWDNPCTIALISIGEEKNKETNIRDILVNAVDILTRERVGDYAGGLDAFDAWAASLSDESQFPKGSVLPVLFDRLMCQYDAMCMIGEGRSYAGCFMEWAGEKYENLKDKFIKASTYLKDEFKLTSKMAEILGGWQHGEKQMKNLADPEIRKEIVKLIMKARELDIKALEQIKQIIDEI